MGLIKSNRHGETLINYIPERKEAFLGVAEKCSFYTWGGGQV